MTITAEDIKFRKSVVQTDTDANGGRLGTVEVLSGVRHALFPRVTKSQREAGLIRHRKEFLCNENSDNEVAYGVVAYLMRPSNAQDRFYLAEGTHWDTQSLFARKSDIDTYAASRYARVWMGCGELNAALSGSEQAVQLVMEADDFQFPNDGFLYLSNNTMTGQTIDADVKIGDSVTYSAGSWSKISHTDDIAYPNGWCAAAGEVLTFQSSTHEEFLKIAKNEYTGEIIGTGDGTTVSPTLSALTHAANGICRQPELLPVVKATCGGVERTVNVSATGVCTGYCSDGELNMETGAWTTDIVWTTAPDNGENVTITYCERAYSYSGNVATVELADQVANAYSADGTTYGAGCLYADELICAVENWEETSASGTYDEIAHPLVLHNDGTVDDHWSLDLSDSMHFTVTGAYFGNIGSGTIGVDFSPINPDTGQPYMTLAGAGFGGTWAGGDKIVFTTLSASLPLILCEEVPAGTPQEPNNLLPVGTYTE